MDSRDRQGPFLDRLEAELEALSPWAHTPLETIFVGGGTPSLLRPALWDRLLTCLDRHFDLSLIKKGNGEFTVECNPETVTPELMSLLAAGGVNRVSMGAQSFDERHLKTLERWHDSQSVPKALEMAQAAGIDRRSIDLIFGIPGQTTEDWERDLSLALDLNTEHLSCYNLTYEQGTAMTARLARGEFDPVSEDDEVQMYLHTVEQLAAHGLGRYEVSNYARPQGECAHNLAYWRQEQWLAAGPSASAHVHGHRWKNAPRLDDYLAHSESGFAPIVDHEPPDQRRGLAEKIMTGIRLAEGLDAEKLKLAAQSLNRESAENLEKAAENFTGQGLLCATSSRWMLTDKGFLFADFVASELMGALTD